MSNWKNITLDINATVSDAIKILNKNSTVLISNKDNKLLGVITDRDIRKMFLQTKSIEDNISKLMNKKPTKLLYPLSEKKIQKIKDKNLFKIYPVVNKNNEIVDVYTNKQIENFTFENLVIIMAGGKGSRLGSLTMDCPKPLLKIGGKTILDTIIHNFSQHNFNNFVISVNYFGYKIKEYFKNKKPKNIIIDFVEEHKPLGTAGSLGLLEKKPKAPFFLINGDILTKVNFSQMLNFHISHKALITVGVREYLQKIPFGVLETKGINIKSIKEKPTMKSFINGGIYIIDPQVLNYIPKGEFKHITEVIEILLKEKFKVIGFPIHEYWIDVGQHNDLQKAETEFEENFFNG